MATNRDGIEIPPDHPDEREALLDWLGFLRRAVVRKAGGLTDAEARWRPEGRLLPVLGIVTHLTRVEWRWIDGGFLGRAVERTDEEFDPGPEGTIADAVAAYRERWARTDGIVRSLPVTAVCHLRQEASLRWVLLHLINETARHAGHADATRQLLDGTTGT